MRSTLITLGLLMLAAPARAGVYNLSEHHPFVPFGEARGYVLKLRSAAEPTQGMPSPESFRAQILRQTAELERLKADGPFATLDRVNLSACYLRQGRPADALKLILEVKSDHFLLLSNLASAYFQSGDLEMAARTQEGVLGQWPKVWAGWNEGQNQFYRDCERHLLRLFQERNNEARSRKTAGFHVDDLFPRFRFVGSTGKYEAGALSTSMRDRLPVNGIAIIYQLSCWYPGDQRIYWLLGEALNAQGNVEAASEVFDELVRNGRAGLFLDLAEHRRTLRAALPIYREVKNPTKLGTLLSMLLTIPRPMPGAAVIGDATYAAASCAAIEAVPYFSKPVLPDDMQNQLPPPPPLPFNWKHIVAGFAFGFLVAALIGFQMQEWRRRKTTTNPG